MTYTKLKVQFLLSNKWKNQQNLEMEIIHTGRRPTFQSLFSRFSNKETGEGVRGTRDIYNKGHTGVITVCLSPWILLDRDFQK